MKKITINMLSSADKVSGQGVGSAYLELIKLLKEDAKDIFEVSINKGTKYDILHAHTVDPINYIKLKLTKGVKVV
jgi:1,2-diacylglycerol-3-alpha-glucose alpha-1,2-galactosyltransferase